GAQKFRPWPRAARPPRLAMRMQKLQELQKFPDSAPGAGPPSPSVLPDRPPSAAMPRPPSPLERPLPHPVPASRRLLLAAAAVAAASGAASAQPAAGDDPAQLVALMQRYASALRANDVETLVGLYAPDGVFMPDDRPAAVGPEALRAAY